VGAVEATSWCGGPLKSKGVTAEAPELCSEDLCMPCFALVICVVCLASLAQQLLSCGCVWAFPTGVKWPCAANMFFCAGPQRAGIDAMCSALMDWSHNLHQQQ